MIPREDVKKVKELAKKGYTISQIANELNCDPNYIFSITQTFNIKVEDVVETMWLDINPWNTKRWRG